MHSLKQLNLSHNALSEFDGSTLSQCKQLIELDLSHNEITTLKVNEVHIILSNAPNCSFLFCLRIDAIYIASLLLLMLLLYLHQYHTEIVFRPNANSLEQVFQLMAWTGNSRQNRIYLLYSREFILFAIFTKNLRFLFKYREKKFKSRMK